MTQIDIISGFLGAGKTTLIKKLLDEAFHGQKIVLIENEFGEIGIDGGFLKDAGVEITEMNSGCICCSLVGDFGTALKQVLADYAPDRIVIEPSGVGKLSDVIAAVERVQKEAPALQLHSFVTVVDATKAKIYMKNFGEFFNDQIETAGTIILSRTQDMTEDKLHEVVELLKQHNPNAAIITTPWDQISGDVILSAMAHHSLAEELMAEAKAAEWDDDEDECDDPECSCHHHHHEHDEEGHEHHHHHHHEEHEEHHHHHEHDECCHDHDHEEHEHHHHDHDSCCHDHDHHHHHHHHHGHDADEVFVSWGLETPKKFTEAEIRSALEALDTGAYGAVLRAKGIVPNVEGGWIHFDMVPGEFDVRNGSADYTGRLCVIGSGLKEDQLPGVFGL